MKKQYAWNFGKLKFLQLTFETNSILFCMLFILFFLPGAASADRYQLTYGHQFELCNELAESVMQKDVEFPYSCSLPIPDCHKNIKRVNWEEIPLEGNESLLVDSLFVFNRNKLSEEEKFQQGRWFVDEFMSNSGKGSKIEKANLRFDSNLPLTEIYKISLRECREDAYENLLKLSRYRPVFYAKESNGIDLQGALGRTAIDFFQYGSHFYMHNLGAVGGNPLSIYELNTSPQGKAVIIRVCEFRLTN